MEAPYRRNPAGQANLNVADCMNMIDAARQMMVLLGRIAVQIPQKDCLEAAMFLDELSTEARAKMGPDPASQNSNQRPQARQKSHSG